MSASIVDSLKELLEEHPSLPAQIAEASKPAERPLAAVAYVYNGYDDVTRKHLGQYTYHFKFGGVTIIDSLPEHKEIDDGKSAKGPIVWTTIPLKGEWIAQEIIGRRKYTKLGMVVFTQQGGQNDPLIDGIRVPRKLKEEADAAGETARLNAIQEFVVGRMNRKAGTGGYKIVADQRVAKWMQKYRPDDEMFAEQHAKTDSVGMMATAIEKLTQLVEGITAKNKLPEEMPVIRAGEKREDYKERLAKWVEAQSKE